MGIGDPPLERVGGSSLTPTPGGIYGIVGGCGGAGTPLISGHQMKRFVRAELVNELVKEPDRCGRSGHPGRNPTAPWQGAGVGCGGDMGLLTPQRGSLSPHGGGNRGFIGPTAASCSRPQLSAPGRAGGGGKASRFLFPPSPARGGVAAGKGGAKIPLWGLGEPPPCSGCPMGSGTPSPVVFPKQVREIPPQLGGAVWGCVGCCTPRMGLWGPCTHSVGLWGSCTRSVCLWGPCTHCMGLWGAAPTVWGFGVSAPAAWFFRVPAPTAWGYGVPAPTPRCFRVPAPKAPGYGVLHPYHRPLGSLHPKH